MSRYGKLYSGHHEKRRGNCNRSPTTVNVAKGKRDVIEFDLDESGKTAYFAVQIENEGKKGPWGSGFNPVRESENRLQRRFL